MEKYEKELFTLIKTDCRVIELVSYEWQRVHSLLLNVCSTLKQQTGRDIQFLFWSMARGLKEIVLENNSQSIKTIDTNADFTRTIEDFYLNEDKDTILLMEDFHSAVKDNPSNIRLISDAMREYSYKNKSSRKILFLQSPIKFTKEEFEKEIQIIEIPLPKIDVLRQIANSVLMTSKIARSALVGEKVLKSALGLTIMEARYAFSKAIIESKNNALDDEAIPIIINEKEQIIKRNGILEYYHPVENLNSIGGLSNLKQWIIQRSKAFDENAKKFGLTTPKGILLLGVPGCGKSLTAKAIASEWKFPLLRFDLGKVFGGFVGESEKNIRQALDVATAIAPCVLWIDEIEKGLSGSQSSGRSDGGTSARVFGTFLTWMQEKKEPVFVVATANDISQLPAELLRKGRFDEIFFVDLPSKLERKNIFSIHVNNKKRDFTNINLEEILTLTNGFSGAEIEQVINEALFLSYNGNKELDTESILSCIRATVPLSQTMVEKINSLRIWAQKRARLASEEQREDLENLNIPILKQEYSNPLFQKDNKGHQND